MNFDSSKIIQIKDAIKEIRGDIKEMEKVCYMFDKIT